MKTFAETIKINLDMKDILAKQFQCAVSTVERWATGIAVPHPRIQKLILEFISSKKK